MPTVLIVDDERNIRRTFGMVLRGEGFDVLDAPDGESSLALLDKEGADVVVLDVRLPGMDGLEVLRRIRERPAPPPVLMISGHGTIATAVEAVRLGAFDFLEKPCSRDRVVVAVRNALRLGELDREVRRHRRAADERHRLVGESAALREVLEQVARVAPTDARVLIRGESGVGKELVARAIHRGSRRADRPFVKVNCAAIPEELIESELFGAVRGAYTGAVADRDGKFLQADGGTLFLDEIGDMSPRAQAKVLRALQEGEIERVGDGRVRRVDVRVIAATHRNLEQEVRAGRFREDLFFRLNVVPVTVPPLRERPDDVPVLARWFLERYLRENDLPPREFAPETLRLLRDLPWPGNVRELHNAVERLAIMSRGRRITPDDLRRTGLLEGGVAPAAESGVAAGAATDPAAVLALSPAAVASLGGLVEARRRFEAACIRRCLDETGGNVSAAARLLGIDRTNLHKKIQAYGLAGSDREENP